jgi:hypothetical protein
VISSLFLTLYLWLPLKVQLLKVETKHLFLNFQFFLPSLQDHLQKLQEHLLRLLFSTLSSHLHSRFHEDGTLYLHQYQYLNLLNCLTCFELIQQSVQNRYLEFFLILNRFAPTFLWTCHVSHYHQEEIHLFSSSFQ